LKDQDISLTIKSVNSCEQSITCADLGLTGRIDVLLSCQVNDKIQIIPLEFRTGNEYDSDKI